MDDFSDLLASVRFNGVQEASFPILGTDEADAVEGGVVRPVLVTLHLRRHNSCQTRFWTSCRFGWTFIELKVCFSEQKHL